MSRLFLLFVFVPLIELVILIRLGSVIGFWPTVGIVIGTAALGSALAKTQGLTAFARFQEALAGQRPLVQEMIDGLIILVSAVLLLTPGILTDIVGLMGLFPATRPLIRKLITNNINISVVGSGVRGARPERPPNGGPTEPSAPTTASKKATTAPDGGYETTILGTPAKTPAYRSDPDPN
jgi:UPF0716 protein FxsA